MPRRRGGDADRWFDELTAFMAGVPIWIGPILAVLTFALFKFFFPSFLRSFPNDGAKTLGSLTEQLAWIPMLFFLGAWVFSLFKRITGPRFIVPQFRPKFRPISNRKLSSSEFESLVGEGFRRLGFQVQETGRIGSPDGGVDLVLSKDGEETLVQCKCWNEWKVGVRVVRELYGIMASRGSNQGIIVSKGRFTHDATRFAEGKSLRLIGGRETAELIFGHEEPVANKDSASNVPIAEAVVCPECGSKMILKTARKGPMPGSQFWSCSRFPGCRGKRPQSVGR